MVTAGKGAVDVGIKGTRRSMGIALDAGYLHQAAHRVARHAEVVLKPHLG